jgi:hypothetical protein
MTAHVPSLKDLTLSARPDDAELHRAACRALYAGEHEVFRMLPGLLAKLIERKVWESRNFKSFGQYALSQTSDGLAIRNDQQLWMLKCALDFEEDRHIQEWKSVLREVENYVRGWAVKEGRRIHDFGGKSLERLAKNGGDLPQGITYLPSRAGGASTDRQLLLHGASGVKRYRQNTASRDPVARAIMYVKRMEPADIKRLVKWLTEEGYVK